MTNRMYLYQDQLIEVYKKFGDNVFSYPDIRMIDGYDDRCHKALMHEGIAYDKVGKHTKPPQSIKLSERAIKYIERII